MFVTVFFLFSLFLFFFFQNKKLTLQFMSNLLLINYTSSVVRFSIPSNILLVESGHKWSYTSFMPDTFVRLIDLDDLVMDICTLFVSTSAMDL